MGRPKKYEEFDLIGSIKQYFELTPFMPIIPWVEQHVTMVDDVSSERDKPDFSMYPYQIEPLKQWEDLSIRKRVIVMACEQMR